MDTKTYGEMMQIQIVNTQYVQFQYKKLRFRHQVVNAKYDNVNLNPKFSAIYNIYNSASGLMYANW